MADFVFRISPNILLGSYSISRLGKVARDFGSRYMVVLDPILYEFGTDQKIKDSLEKRNIDYFIYDDIMLNPDTSLITQALSLARKARINGVISIGGTKAANVGRAVAAFFNESHDIYEYLEGAKPTTAPLPYIAIPTTMRDIFLFTDVSPLIDGRNGQVKLLKVQHGICRLALFDSNLSLQFTDNQFTTILLQMLTVCVEAYISQKANFFSDTVIEKAVQFIGDALHKTEPLSSITSRENLASIGGCMTSLGVAASACGAVSLIALAITSRYNMSLSLVSAVLLPYLIEDSARFAEDKMVRLGKILNMAADTSSNEAALNAFVENIRHQLAVVNLPARLKDLSISMEELALAIEDAGQLEYITTLPRSVTTDDLFELVKRAY